MISDALKSFRHEADKINWKQYNINDLFREYIKHENEPIGEQFFAGIICRTWGYAGRVYLQCKKHVPYDQCYDILLDAINYVLKKRVWENPNSSLYNDPAAPDKAFHIALKRFKSLALSRLNSNKRRADFNTMSVDEIHDEYNDAAEGLFDICDDTNQFEDTEIVDFIKSKSPTEIILLDAVCYHDWATLKSIPTFTKRLNSSNIEYYVNKYGLDKSTAAKSIVKVARMSNKDVMSSLNRCLYLSRSEING